MRLPARIALAAAALILAACSSYRLGAPEGGLRGTVFVPVVRNETYAPQIRTLLTEDLREAVSGHGGFRLAADEAGAETVLEVTVTGYAREEVATRGDDTGRGFAFEHRLEAVFTLRSTDGRTVYYTDEPVSAESVIYATPDLVDTEYQNLPVVSEELARRIIRRASDQW